MGKWGSRTGAPRAKLPEKTGEFNRIDHKRRRGFNRRTEKTEDFNRKDRKEHIDKKISIREFRKLTRKGLSTGAERRPRNGWTGWVAGKWIAERLWKGGLPGTSTACYIGSGMKQNGGAIL
jgi:hypothetical protein